MNLMHGPILISNETEITQIMEKKTSWLKQDNMV